MAVGPVTKIFSDFFNGKIASLFFNNVIDSDAVLYASSINSCEPNFGKSLKLATEFSNKLTSNFNFKILETASSILDIGTSFLLTKSNKFS